MDLLSLLTGSENLYKYSFIGGLGLIIISLFYPLNKKYELECQKDLYHKEIKLVNLDIGELKNDVAKLNSHINEFSNAIDSAPSVKAKNAIKDSLNKRFNLILLKRKELSVKQIQIEYNNDRIKTLSNSIIDLTQYQGAFVVIGSIFTLFGFCGWFLLMLKEHKKKPAPHKRHVRP